MKEIVVLSGKGGTGKTTVSCALAAFVKNAVICDCDVDAADMHIILQPENTVEEVFEAGHDYEIDKTKCIQCGICVEVCRFQAVKDNFVIDGIACEGCGLCHEFCPRHAVTKKVKECGFLYESVSRFGPIHAKLHPGEENSGKLVAEVRKRSRKKAFAEKYDFIISDGPPGTGCPVISSLTGADSVLVVTEPTISGIHDMKRVLKLTRHFGIQSMVCVNKSTINQRLCSEIKDFCRAENILFAGEIPVSAKFLDFQMQRKSAAEFPETEEYAVVKSIYEKLIQNVKEIL